MLSPRRIWIAIAAAATACLVPQRSLGQSLVAPQSATAFRNELMPQPASIQVMEGGAFPINSEMTVALRGVRSPRLQAGVLRTLKRLEDRTGQQLPRQISPGETGSLTLTVDTDGAAVQDIDEDESYTLVSTPTSIQIHASTTTGALHALETLVQLAQPSGAAYIVPSVTVRDTPRFRWRGLMIDCARHFEPIEVLERNLDGMAAVKLNVFHWHLTDDQGFRIESKAFPKLTSEGSDGKFYTQQEARELVRYARDRGIRVVPEFEMPGHSAAWLVAYPELASGTEPGGIRREFGISDVAIDPTREETYRFLEQFLREMTTIFPDQYVHIGGDETPAPDWKQNPKILAFKKAHDLPDNEALQAYFNQRLLAILTRLHRRMMGWDEIFNPALPKDVVVQSWRGEASLTKGAQGGYQGVLSAPYYLDGMKPAEVHYLSDPIPADTILTSKEQRLILGGEVCMWGEHLDARTLDSRLWPRTAAIAERFWSPQSVRDVNSMYQRLEPVSIELEGLGLHHLTARDAGLRELVGSEEINALRTLSTAFEPVGFHDRYQGQHTSQLTPLTGFVDAVRPDPRIRHELELATQAFLADPRGMSAQGVSARHQIQTFFEEVAGAVPEVRHQMAASPRLQLMEVRVDQLAALSAVGLEAIRLLSTGTAAPAGWKAANLTLVERAKAPSGLVRFTFLPPLTNLINATP